MKFLPLLFLIPMITFAQAGEVMVGNVPVSYEEQVAVDGVVLYYQAGALVASAHDYDGDGFVDTWLKYTGDLVELEATDTDGDGVADVYTSVTAEGEVINTEGEGAVLYEQPAVVEFEELVEGGSEAAAPDDLVGPLDRITIPGRGGFSWGIAIVVLLLAIGGYRFYKKRKFAAAEL